MNYFQPPVPLSTLLEQPAVGYAIYLMSSLYIQILNADVFNKFRPYSYFLSPLCVLLPGNLMLFFFGQIQTSLDANIYILLAHFIISFIVLNVNMNTKNIKLITGLAMIFFNTNGLVIYYSRGYDAYGLVGAFIVSYIVCVLTSYVYMYIVIYIWQKHLIKIYANPKSLLQNTVLFVVIFVAVALLHSIRFPNVYVLVMAFYALLYLDENFWHKLPELFAKAKID